MKSFGSCDDVTIPYTILKPKVPVFIKSSITRLSASFVALTDSLARSFGEVWLKPPENNSLVFVVLKG